MNKNCFPPQSEPHTAKLCIFVVLKHFFLVEIDRELFFLDIKMTIS